MDKGTKMTMKSSQAEDEGTRGMAWCYYVVTVLAEDPDLDPAFTWCLVVIYNYSARLPDTL